MKRYILFAISGLLMASCMDTEVLPVDKVIEEDFWKNSTEVKSMVNGAYKSMTSEAVIERMIVWGELRGDNVVPSEGLGTTKSGINEIHSLSIDDKNAYAVWASFYDVINRCNLVLDHAEAVMSIDPSYTEGDYRIDRSQMLALRSLCYFYLVRAFRDVPYIATANQYSSQEFEIAQSAPNTVLENCIRDLEEAATVAYKASGFNGWRSCGLITRDAIYSILADVYLWRASLNKSAADYQKCVDYCNLVINTKQEYELSRRGGALISYMLNDYPLYTYNNVYNQVFRQGNSAESIFELQLDGNVAVNTAVRNLYYQYKEGVAPGFLSGAKFIGTNNDGKKATDISGMFVSKNDIRYAETVFDQENDNNDSYSIYKMAHPRVAEYAKFDQNWIVYRVSDVMLMKAEALVQLAPEGAALASDDNLKEAFKMVETVYNRSLKDQGDVLNAADAEYNDRNKMETLVLCERQRELCFEGKRWFDLMRYAYRHMNGVDPNTILAKTGVGENEVRTNEQGFPAIPTEMIDLLKRKYTDNSGVLTYQLTTEPKLYFPIGYDEMKVNSNLFQTPGYKSSNEYEKNY